MTTKYRVVTYTDNTVKRIYHLKSEDGAQKKFDHFANNKVMFKTTHTCTNITKRSVFKVHLERLTEPNDADLRVRDLSGNLIDPVQSNGYTILKISEWKKEELFNVFGLKKKMTFMEILKTIIMKRRNKHGFHVIGFKNKLLLANSPSDFDIVVCKAPENCDRFMLLLLALNRDYKSLKLLILGQARGEVRTQLVGRIRDKTGWRLARIYYEYSRIY